VVDVFELFHELRHGLSFAADLAVVNRGFSKNMEVNDGP